MRPRGLMFFRHPPAGYGASAGRLNGRCQRPLMDPFENRATTFEEGGAKFAELSKRYYERFFDHDFKSTKKACFSTSVYGGPLKKVSEDIVPA